MVDGTEKKTGEQPSWMERLGMDATAALDIAEKQQQEYVLAQQKTEQQREAVQKAIENGTSVLGGLLETQKPQYDRQKEKRLRNTAIAQSIGDMFSAAARGAFAFGKRGMGYVPKVNEGSSALKSIENINKMQEEYRKRNEDWKALELKYKQAQADAETEAAKQLLTAKESAEERARKRSDDATAEAREAYRKYLQAGIDAEEKEAQRQWRAEDREDRQASTAAIKELGDKYKKKELTEDGYIFTQLHKDETYEETTTRPEEAFDDKGNIITKDVITTSKKLKTYTIEEANAMGKYDSQVQKVKQLMREGHSMDEAIAKVMGK